MSANTWRRNCFEGCISLLMFTVTTMPFFPVLLAQEQLSADYLCHTNHCSLCFFSYVIGLWSIEGRLLQYFCNHLNARCSLGFVLAVLFSCLKNNDTIYLRDIFPEVRTWFKKILLLVSLIKILSNPAWLRHSKVTINPF